MIKGLYIQAICKITLFTAVLLSGAVSVAGQEILCMGSTKQFGVDLNENNGNGSTGSVYTWQVSGGAFGGNIVPLTPSGNKVEIQWGTTPIGTYTLTVTENSNGCLNTQELQIQLRDEIELNELEDLLICPEGGSVTFNAGFGYDSYNWYNQDGELLSETRLLTVSEPGTYFLEVTQNECTATQSVEAIPMDFPAFTVNTDAFNTIVVEHLGGNIENLEYQLENLNGDIIKSWQVSNVFNGIGQGFYIVRIRSWDATCYTYITAATVGIPNVITPNGDGYNDIWDLTRLYQYAPDAKIEVYDRYGKLLKIISAENGFKWDGKYQGKPLPSTSYVYILYLDHEKITGYLLIKNY